jgi:hypothetical protein
MAGREGNPLNVGRRSVISGLLSTSSHDSSEIELPASAQRARGRTGSNGSCRQRLKDLQQIEFTFAVALVVACVLFISLVGLISESVVIDGNETVVLVDDNTTGPMLYTSRSHHPIASSLISSLENGTGTESEAVVLAALDAYSAQHADTEHVLETCFIALGVSLACLLTFSCMRHRQPELVDCRSAGRFDMSGLPRNAADPVPLPPGLFAWLPALFLPDDAEFRRVAGYDALAVARYLALALKFCAVAFARGESVIKCPFPLNVLKDTYDHS